MGAMPKAVTQQVATKLEWKPSEESPPQRSPLPGSPAVPAVDSTGMALRALARVALPDSRPLEDWESKATDDFFGSHFS